MTKTEQFLKLVQENPTLRIIPMVDSEIVADDGYNWWYASFGRSDCRECIKVSMYEDYEQMVFRDDAEDYEDFLFDALGENYFHLSNEEIEGKVQKIIDAQDWEKVITVNIDLPD